MPSFESIAGFELTEVVAASLARDGIRTPTPVQLAAVAAVIAGKNVVIQSGTGTGKTLAYLLPILQQLHQSPAARAVCIVPSIELAMQVMRVAERYKAPEVSAVALVARDNPRRKSARLQSSTRLVIGTPERVLEAFANRKLKGITMLVLDEPEPVIASRNAAFLKEVLTRPEPKVQLIFVGATFGIQAEQWIRNLLGHDVTRTQVDDDPLTHNITHQFVRVHHEGEKDVVLARFLRRHECKRAIVFVNQPYLVRHLYRYLIEQGYSTVSVSPDRSKQECKQALSGFAAGKASVLLTTDSVATGLDVPNVKWVLHFELPNSPESYVHRAGRTGRAGQSGTSVLFVSEPDRIRLKQIEKKLGISFQLRDG